MIRLRCPYITLAFLNKHFLVPQYIEELIPPDLYPVSFQSVKELPYANAWFPIAYFANFSDDVLFKPFFSLMYNAPLVITLP
jgi:hypothetical protein